MSHLEPSTFSGLIYLENISLTSNQLTYIDPSTFRGKARLEYIWLNSNNLTSLHPDTFKRINCLRIIDISKNQVDFKVTQNKRGCKVVDPSSYLIITSSSTEPTRNTEISSTMTSSFTVSYI